MHPLIVTSASIHRKLTQLLDLRLAFSETWYYLISWEGLWHLWETSIQRFARADACFFDQALSVRRRFWSADEAHVEEGVRFTSLATLYGLS